MDELEEFSQVQVEDSSSYLEQLDNEVLHLVRPFVLIGLSLGMRCWYICTYCTYVCAKCRSLLIVNSQGSHMCAYCKHGSQD